MTLRLTLPRLTSRHFTALLDLSTPRTLDLWTSLYLSTSPGICVFLDFFQSVDLSTSAFVDLWTC